MTMTPAKEVRITKAKKGDIPSIILIREITRDTTYSTSPSNNIKKQPVKINEMLITKYKSYLKDPQKNFYVARYKQKIVGFIYSKNDVLLKQTRIRSLFILREFQNMGIGSLLLKKAIAVAPFDEISLAVVRMNQNAINFYSSHGFKIVDTECKPFSYKGERLERIEMSYKPSSNTKQSLSNYNMTMARKILIIFPNNATKFVEILRLIKERIKDKAIIEVVYSYKTIQIIYSYSEDQLYFTIGKYNLKDFDTVMMYVVKRKNSDYSALISHFCQANNIRIINSREGFNYSVGKILQKLLMVLEHIPTADFVYMGEDLNANYKTLSRRLGRTFVAKLSRTTLGKGTFLVKDEKDFKILNEEIQYKQNKKGLLFFEKYIPHEQSFRGFVTGSECYTKITVNKEKNTFRTNHGEAVFIKNTDKEFGDLCVKAAKLMKLEIAGVDTVLDPSDQTIKVLEINKSPGITIEPFVSPEIDNIADLLTEKNGSNNVTD